MNSQALIRLERVYTLAQDKTTVLEAVFQVAQEGSPPSKQGLSKVAAKS